MSFLPAPWVERIGTALARWHLRACTSVGARTVLRGPPIVLNSGVVVIGDDFSLSSAPVRSHLVASGTMRIGDRVHIGGGAAISCVGEIEIGDDVSIGDFAMIFDSDFHVADDIGAIAAPKPIRIAQGVRVGHRVVILPGSTIGAGAVVKAGSVISGVIPDNAIVEGNPARPSRPNDGSSREASLLDIPSLVMQVLGLTSLPDVQDGPKQIAKWDSFGSLRLIVAIEERFGVALSEDQFKSARSIGELAAHVKAAQRTGWHEPIQ